MVFSRDLWAQIAGSIETSTNHANSLLIEFIRGEFYLIKTHVIVDDVGDRILSSKGCVTKGTFDARLSMNIGDLCLEERSIPHPRCDPLGLWSKINSHQGIVAATIRMTVKPCSQKKLQAIISVLEATE